MSEMNPHQSTLRGRPRPWWVDYALPVAAMTVATVVRLVLDPRLGDLYPFATYLGAVTVVAWFGRTRHAAFTLVISGLLAFSLFISPRSAFAPTDPAILLGMAFNLTVAAVVVAMSHQMRVARARAERLLAQALVRQDELGQLATVEAEQRERLRTTLASIGDAVITTDTAGRVTNLNAVAESLTGWTNVEAGGQPLDAVFRIINETTRQPVESPASRALRDGMVVGLANHTVLIAKDDTERPIDDSAAPIRSAAGDVIGCVLVFRDITARHRQAAGLRASEERLRTALTAARMVAWEWTPADRKMRVSENASDVFGLAAGAGLTGIDQGLALVHPEDVAAYRDTFRKAIADRTGYLTRYRLIRPDDGRVIWIEERGETVFDQPGEGARLFGVAMDVTDRRQAEEAMRSSGARHSFLVELADTLRPLSDPMDVQAEASRVLGERLQANRVTYFEVREGDYLVERAFTDGVPPMAGRYSIESFGPELLATYCAGRTAYEGDVDAQDSRSIEERAAFAGIQTRAYIGVPLVKDGVLVAGLAVHAKSPREWTPTEIAIAEDTAERTWAAVERVRAERDASRLAADADRERRLFAAVLSNTPDFIYTFDLHGRFVYVNAALLALWGRTLDEVVGKNFFDLDYPASLAALLQRQIQQVIDTKQTVRDETPYTSRVGERMYEYIFAPVVGAGNTVEAVAGSTRDITDRKLAEAERERLVSQLREQDRRKNEFLATLAHELRNPLAPLHNGLHVMRLAGADGTVEVRSMMERQLKHLTRLVDDLLDMNRVTSGKLQLLKARVEVRAVIDDAVETSRPAVEQAGHELAVVVPEEPIFVDGDRIRLAQVVSNLLSNSARYTGQRGHIRVSVERDDGVAVITVSDDGIGIPTAMLEAVFGMFTQLDRTLEKTTGGLGIGLSLVKGLVEMHGGTVEARSEGEGRGSKFVVRLPVATSAVSEPELSAGGVVEGASVGFRRILVVDDNVDSADSLARFLEMLGHEVRTAYDGEGGIEAAKTFRPSVVLCDIGMPRVNGHNVARCLRAEKWGEDVVLIALTGWGQEDDRQRSAEAGFDHHLIKPVDYAALMTVLGGM